MIDTRPPGRHEDAQEFVKDQSLAVDLFTLLGPEKFRPIANLVICYEEVREAFDDFEGKLVQVFAEVNAKTDRFERKALAQEGRITKLRAALRLMAHPNKRHKNGYESICGCPHCAHIRKVIEADNDMKDKIYREAEGG